MDTTKIKGTQMAKTPEELTADWKAGKLHKRFDEPKLFYCKTDNGIEILKTWGYKNLEFLSMSDEVFEPVDNVQILTPVPSYDELQQLKEYERIVTSYTEKPINYDIACETVNKLLDEKEQLKKELESARWYQTVQNEDIAKLRALLKECLPEVKSQLRSVEFTKMISQSKEPERKCTYLKKLLTRINEALK